MKKLLLSGLLLSLSCVSLFGITSAAFEENVKVAGVSFSVAEEIGEGGGTEDPQNTDLKILLSNSAGTESGNLADSIAGPSFSNINAAWEETIGLKIHNQGSKELALVASAEYINDPETLRDDIFVEILAWDDANNDGIVDNSEVGESFGYDSILRLRNDTFVLNTMQGSETQGYVLKFDGTGLSEANINDSAIYDFVFTGVEVGVSE